MATKNKTIENSVTGERITWLETSADTNGKYLRFIMTLAPGGQLPVTHIHPSQTERFETRKGIIAMEIEGRKTLLAEGQSKVIDRHIPHKFSNPSKDKEVEVEITFTPAGKTEVFLEQFFGLSNEGKTNAEGTPAFLQLMAMANTFEIYIAGPPIIIQKIMSVVIGGIGRLLGYKRFYKKYSPDTTKI